MQSAIDCLSVIGWGQAQASASQIGRRVGVSKCMDQCVWRWNPRSTGAASRFAHRELTFCDHMGHHGMCARVTAPYQRFDPTSVLPAKGRQVGRRKAGREVGKRPTRPERHHMGRSGIRCRGPTRVAPRHLLWAQAIGAILDAAHAAHRGWEAFGASYKYNLSTNGGHYGEDGFDHRAAVGKVHPRFGLAHASARPCRRWAMPVRANVAPGGH